MIGSLPAKHQYLSWKNKEIYQNERPAGSGKRSFRSLGTSESKPETYGQAA